eukprot:GFUD01039419.1.p1 GENE.GFUD01039419.1~~GFUD01039419.1.p1  ORF type:complete len:864 (+),score=224.28 GFUD01039419.1:73-2664(+)
MSGIVKKRKIGTSVNREGLKKVKKVETGESENISKKILSKYDKINEELNKAGTNTGVKVEMEQESLNFTELIRSKIGDLLDDDPEDISDEEESMSDNLEIKQEKDNLNLIGSNTSEIVDAVKSIVVGDIIKIQRQVVKSLGWKNKEIQDLKDKVQKSETDKAVYVSKYKKYKEMAVKLSKGNRPDSQDLENENLELREKLKSVLNKLGNEEESKCDVSSKLALKDQMLQEQLKKNHELEVKIKNFVTRFFDKMENSSKAGTVANLNKSMEESQITDYLANSNKSLLNEISSQYVKNLQDKSKVTGNSEEATVQSYPRLKRVRVNLKNVGVKGLQKGVKQRKIKNKSFPGFEKDPRKTSLTFGVLKDEEVGSSMIQNLIVESENQSGDDSSRRLKATFREPIDETSENEHFSEETKMTRKYQMRKLSDEISMKKFEIKRLEVGSSSPVYRRDPEVQNKSFEVLPAADDDAKVPLKLKIVNIAGKPVEEENIESSRVVRAKASKLTQSNTNLKTMEYQTSPKNLQLNPNISMQKKIDSNLPSSLLKNSSISIGRSVNPPKVASSLEVKNVPEVPFSLPGISLVKSSGRSVSNPAKAVQGNTDALVSNSSLSFKKVSETPIQNSSTTPQKTVAAHPNNSSVTYAKVSTPQGQGRSNISSIIRRTPVLGNLNLSITRPTEPSTNPHLRPNISIESRNDSLMSNSQLSIRKSSESPSNEFVPDSLSNDKVSSLKTNRSISITKTNNETGLNSQVFKAVTTVAENPIVKVALDVLKELDPFQTSLDEDIPLEASDYTSEVTDSVVSGVDETTSLSEGTSISGEDYDMTKYDSLMSEIDSQLKKFTEQNQQFELRKLTNNDDEKLLLDEY